jgi:hypothetical protein
LGAGEMDLQVILGSFGHWQGGLWLSEVWKLKLTCTWMLFLTHKSWTQIEQNSLRTS